MLPPKWGHNYQLGAMPASVGAMPMPKRSHGANSGAAPKWGHNRQLGAMPVSVDAVPMPKRSGGAIFGAAP